jgi:hypothetical protein
MKRFSTVKKAMLISCSITLSTLSSGSVFGMENIDTQKPDEQIHRWDQQFEILEQHIQKLTDKVEALTARFDNVFSMLPIAPVVSHIPMLSNEIRISGFVPPIARSHEEEYQRFMAGALIYRPKEGSAIGQIVIPIASIANQNTLEGTFDLSRFGDISQYLSISTGFRKGKINANENKTEVWIVPKFVVDQNINGAARHLQPIRDRWTAPYGIFFTWGNWNNLDWFDYEVTKDPATISSEKLLEIAYHAHEKSFIPTVHWNRTDAASSDSCHHECVSQNLIVYYYSRLCFIF